MLFEYPKKAEFDRIVPKTKIYERAKPSKKLRERFVAEVGQIVWKYKLAPETINLPAREGVREIQVFTIAAKTELIGEEVLRCIDKTIPSPILYEISFEDRIKSTFAYKRQSDSSTNAWVVELYFSTNWTDGGDRHSLPVALDMASLYEELLLPMADVNARSGETLRELAERVGEIRACSADCKKLERKISTEKQFNRKVELNSELREIQQQIARLSSDGE